MTRRRLSGRLACLLALLALPVSVLSAQIASDMRRSVVVLLDCSYSMGMALDGSRERRIDVALRLIRDLARRAEGGEEWALLLMGEPEPPAIAIPFAADIAPLIDRHAPYEPDGSTPLARGLDRAAGYLTEKAKGGERRILLVSDGIATDDDAYRLPDAGFFRSRRIPIVAVIIGVPEVGVVQDAVRQLAEGSGGAAFDARELASGGYPRLLAALRRPDPPRPSAAPVPAAPAESRPPPAVSRAPASLGVRATGVAGGAPFAALVGRVSVSRVDEITTTSVSTVKVEERRVSLRLIWLALPVLGLAIWRLSRRIGELRRALGRPRSKVSYRSVLRLEVRSPGAVSGQVVLRDLPALIGGSEEAHLRLAGRQASRPRPDFRIGAATEGAMFDSAVALNINGVARKHKMLRSGDSVAYNGHRVIFRELATERFVLKAPPVRVGVPWELGLLGAALLLGLLLWNPVTLSFPRRIVVRSPLTEVRRVEVASLTVLGGRAGAPQGRAGGPRGGSRPPMAVSRALAGAGGGAVAAVPTVAVRPETGMGIPPVNREAIDESAAGREPLFVAPRASRERSEVRVYAPGEKIDYFRADALFVHAHPDDESIDFGVLMAREAASGKRLVNVLFTDGEAGLDQYPARAVGGMYADRDLRPEELAVVRPREAREALSQLGAAAYIRLGLRNHPYSSSRQVLSLEALLADWGGEEAVVARLVEIIEGFRPTLVVSPDSAHGGAHEHFEHAGVGYIVRLALQRVRERGRHSVLLHLRSVDPRFRDAYDHVESVDALERVGALTLRGVQVRALAEHRTQRDATIVAVESLTARRSEYYVADQGAVPLDRFLATW